jgi:ribulose-phosphate 3-epimerase
MHKIIPAILAKNLKEFDRKISKVSKFFDEIQIDIIEDSFANNATVELVNISSLPKDRNYQVHLMVTDPVGYLFHCKRLGAKTIIFHNEIEKDTGEIIEKIREQDFNIFLGIAPESGIETFEKYIKLVDGVLLMGVKPGFSGQSFQPNILNKIKELRKKHPELIIEIDGGINFENIKEIFDAGANILVVNSILFKKKYLKPVVNKLNLFTNQ